MSQFAVFLMSLFVVSSSVFAGHDPEKNPSLACQALLQTMSHKRASVVSDSRVERAREVLGLFPKGDSVGANRRAWLLASLNEDRSSLVMLNFRDGADKVEKSLTKFSKMFRLMHVEEYGGFSSPIMTLALGVYALDAFASLMGGGPVFRSAALAFAGVGRGTQKLTASTEGRLIESVGLGAAALSFFMEGMNQLPVMSANVEVAGFLAAAALSRAMFPRLPRYVSDVFLLGAGATWLFLSGDQSPYFINQGLPLFIGGLFVAGHGVYEFVDRFRDKKRIGSLEDNDSYIIPEIAELRTAALEDENSDPQHIYWDAPLDKPLLDKLRASRWGRENSEKIAELKIALQEDRQVLIKVDQLWAKHGKKKEVLMSSVRIVAVDTPQIESDSTTADQSE